jgi:hypothetical protein
MSQDISDQRRQHVDGRAAEAFKGGHIERPFRIVLLLQLIVHGAKRALEAFDGLLWCPDPGAFAPLLDVGLSIDKLINGQNQSARRDKSPDTAMLELGVTQRL